MKTPTAIDRRPVFPGSWAASVEEEGPRRAPTEGPRSPPGDPRRPQDGPKTAPRGPKIDPERPKMAPRCFQRGMIRKAREPDGSKMVHRGSKEARRKAREAQDGPKLAAKWSQGGPKKGPRWPKMAFLRHLKRKEAKSEK